MAGLKPLGVLGGVVRIPFVSPRRPCVICDILKRLHPSSSCPKRLLVNGGKKSCSGIQMSASACQGVMGATALPKGDKGCACGAYWHAAPPIADFPNPPTPAEGK